MKNVTQSRLPLYAFVAFTFFMFALPAEAHLNSTGMGPFYDGLIHFLMSPEDIVPVLASRCWLVCAALVTGGRHSSLFRCMVARRSRRTQRYDRDPPSGFSCSGIAGGRREVSLA
jgi:hypothetical protein